MKIKGWKYYNFAAIPTTPPHEKVNLEPLKDKSIWKLDGKPLFVRYTENFDQYNKSNWWYCIKDEPFNMEQINAKRRNLIRKGISLNRIEIVKSADYISDIYSILENSYKDYPIMYKPELIYDKVVENCKKWDDSHVVFMAFSKESEKVVGFAVVKPVNDYVDFQILKVPNENKKDQVSTALIYKILMLMLNEKKYKYVSDGERNLVHQTNFMDYLVKQFAFRYAYCDLKIVYKFRIKVIVRTLFPLRKIIYKLKRIPIFYKISAVLKMEEISQT